LFALAIRPSELNDFENAGMTSAAYDHTARIQAQLTHNIQSTPIYVIKVTLFTFDPESFRLMWQV
jgi:hypothetical protein